MSKDSGTARKTALAFIYSAALLLSVPFMWKLEVYLRAHHLLKITVYSLLALYLLIVIISFFRYTERKLAPAIVLIGYSILYAVLIIQSKGFDKKIHFIEYGILTFLVFRAFAVRVSEWARYGWTFLIALMVGFADEGLQHFIPGRSFDPGDFLSNVEASALMLLLLFIVGKYRTGANDN